MKTYTEEEIKLLEAHNLVENGKIEETEAFYDEAMEYYNMAMEIYDELKYPKGKVEVLNATAMILQNKGEYQQSLERLEAALAIAQDNGFYFIKSKIYLRQGIVFENLADYANARCGGANHEDHRQATKNQYFRGRYRWGNDRCV